jgi:hypothetical protein
MSLVKELDFERFINQLDECDIRKLYRKYSIVAFSNYSRIYMIESYESKE